MEEGANCLRFESFSDRSINDACQIWSRSGGRVEKMGTESTDAAALIVDGRLTVLNKRWTQQDTYSPLLL